MSNLKQTFDEQGYITIAGFLPNQEVSELRREIARFITHVVPMLPESHVFYENKNDPRTLKQVQQLSQHDDYFRQLATSKKVTSLAETLLDGEVRLMNTQYFNKVPRIGKATPPHQDGYYFMIQPQQAITMWLSLGQADAENGAIAYVRGSHLKGLRRHSRSTTLGFSQTISDWSDEDLGAEQQMQADAGDILVHHSLTIHRGNANYSNRDRKAIGFIFYRDDVVIDETEHATYQAHLTRELRTQGEI